MAIWALVLVIVLGAIGALVGIPLAYSARSKIRQSYGALKGSGLALAALIIGWAYIALIVLAIAIPTFIGVTHPTGSSAPAASGQDAEASAIGLQPSDLGPGFAATSAAVPVTTHAILGPCTPLSGGPWLAYQSSPYFTSSSGSLTATSAVVTMPTPHDAELALMAIGAPSYGVSCFLPSTNAAMTSGLASLGTSCGLSLENPGISNLSVSTASGILSGYRYSADIFCAKSGTSEPYVMDTVNQVVGPYFLQTRFRAIGAAPPADLEERAMNSMAARASKVIP